MAVTLETRAFLDSPPSSSRSRPRTAFARTSFPSSSATTQTSYAPSGESQGHALARDGDGGSDARASSTPSPSASHRAAPTRDAARVVALNDALNAEKFRASFAIAPRQSATVYAPPATAVLYAASAPAAYPPPGPPSTHPACVARSTVRTSVVASTFLVGTANAPHAAAATRHRPTHPTISSTLGAFAHTSGAPVVAVAPSVCAAACGVTAYRTIPGSFRRAVRSKPVAVTRETRPAATTPRVPVAPPGVASNPPTNAGGVTSSVVTYASVNSVVLNTSKVSEELRLNDGLSASSENTA